MNACACARTCAIGLSALFVICGWCQFAWAQAITPGNIERGKKLFEHVWQFEEGPGDGLGPMFNERSCVACHFQGGAGGAGPNEHNVEVLTLAPSQEPGFFGGALQQLVVFHPGFADGTLVVLHRSSSNPLYPIFRDRLTAQKQPRSDLAHEAGDSAESASGRAFIPIKRLRSASGLPLMICQRSTTPLFGAGLIDHIRLKDIEAGAKQQHSQDPNVSGRRAGRFGWRGQVESLDEFVLGACAVELGLEVPRHHQSFDPNAPRPAAWEVQPLDLTKTQCDDLVRYVASLPPPRVAMPTDQGEIAAIARGKGLFRSTGCAVCHRPTLGSVTGIYSDLLMHDMGESLEDAAAAPSTVYYGTADYFSPLAAERRREWKTPPLWGLRDSAPYLHDGRAPTLENAIRWHGGEASGSVDRFLDLSPSDQLHVLAFLSTLAAPADPERIAAARSLEAPVKPAVFNDAKSER